MDFGRQDKEADERQEQQALASTLLDAIWGQTMWLAAVQERAMFGYDVAGSDTSPNDLGKI